MESVEEEDVKEDYDFVTDSPTDRGSPVEEVPVEEQISEPLQDDTPDSPTLPPVTDSLALPDPLRTGAYRLEIISVVLIISNR